MKQKTTNIILLSFIVIIGFLLRIYRLDLNIPPLYADETGQYWLYQSLIGGHLNIFSNLYLGTYSLVWVFGLNPMGVRLSSALFGSFIGVALFYFGLVVSKRKKIIAIICGVLGTIIPWSYMISRIGHTHIPIIVILSSLHLALLINAKSFRGFLVSLFPLALSVFYYPTVLIVSPIAVLIVFFKFFYTRFNNHQKWVTIVAGASLALVFGYLFITRYNIFSVQGRGGDLAIWRDVNTHWEIDKYRALSWNSEPTLFSFGLPPEQLANKLVYNRAMANLSTFAHNYFSFFSPDWLFFKGDAILRHSTGQVGAFYPFLTPFMLYGAFVFFKTADKKTKWTFLIWILVSPVPAAITKDGAGYLLRVVTMLPFLTYFCALGLVESFNLIKKNWRIPYGIMIGLIGLYSAYYFFYGYFHVYPALSARSYEYGFKELSDFQVANDNSPILVIWDGYYHNNDFRFWQATSFDQYKAFKTNEIVVGESHFWQTFPNLYFVNPKSEKDLLIFLRQYIVSYVVLPDRYFVNYPVQLDKDFASPSAVINYPDQTPALKIYSVPSYLQK